MCKVSAQVFSLTLQIKGLDQRSNSSLQVKTGNFLAFISLKELEHWPKACSFSLDVEPWTGALRLSLDLQL